jgi:hypothetical protein
MSEVQKWQRYAIAQDLLDRYQREGDDFLGRFVTLDETWTRSYFNAQEGHTAPILSSDSCAPSNADTPPQGHTAAQSRRPEPEQNSQLSKLINIKLTL